MAAPISSSLQRKVRIWADAAARYAKRAARKAFPDTATPAEESWRREMSSQDARIIDEVRPYSMTSVERLSALIEAVRYVVRGGISGSIVECGVWRGGSMMAVAQVLIAEGQADRNLYLYDTYEGMSAPSDLDRSHDGTSAHLLWKNELRTNAAWCYSAIDEVEANLRRTGYPMELVHLIKGKVEDTIPKRGPGPLALLRLDTDWYESTRHELEHLFPLLNERGVLIVDDYGYWQGARKATDEFLAAQTNRYYLHRIDYTGRLLVKA